MPELVADIEIMSLGNGGFYIDYSVQNNEDYDYTGEIRIYILETESTMWDDFRGKPYNHAFLDFAANEDISISANGNISVNKHRLADTAGYGDVYSENLYIIAVIFNANATIKFSDPPHNTQSFEAHYTDAVIGKRLSD